MRICLVSAAYRPYLSGVSEHVHNLALGLKKLGHEVHLLTARYGRRDDDSRSPFPVTRVGRALVLPAHGGYFTLPVGLGLPAQVRRFMAANDDFDVVHCHGIFPPETAYWAALHARAPVVVTFHTLVFRAPGFARAAFRAIFAGLTRRVAAHIAVSQACARWAESWFPGPCRIIPNGVNTEAFHPGTKAAGREPSILYVSRLDRRKGLPVLLSAMPEVVRQVPQVTLDVVGSGPLERECRQTCRRLGIEGAVRFLGPLQPDELPARYAGCTVFAAPAQGRESMGIILVEAMASGRPVVASRIVGYDEVVEDGRNGLLVPPGDSQAWASTLIAVLRDSSLRERLGTAALERARQFAWPVVTEQVERIYRDVAR